MSYGHDVLVVRSLLSDRKVPGSELDSVYMHLVHIKSEVFAKHPPNGGVRKFEEGFPARVMSQSSDRGSRRRGSSQNIPRVASKWDVNVNKLELAWRHQIPRPSFSYMVPPHIRIPGGYPLTLLFSGLHRNAYQKTVQNQNPSFEYMTVLQRNIPLRSKVFEGNEK
ncbi:hypothetical protein AVEN_191438-1 [Araneus ventricosus]|uniref:Uncharacterized protein n=1 Tax=Araneus ventricosus TaxID=182803 RepID=A0A4Y2SRF2_ARAVE|nr:hypothetical protein AVEN_191438-1 [Araneus ventricosus]